MPWSSSDTVPKSQYDAVLQQNEDLKRQLAELKGATGRQRSRCALGKGGKEQEEGSSERASEREPGERGR
eukprot:3507965-Rhodomonas_salina.1